MCIRITNGGWTPDDRTDGRENVIICYRYAVAQQLTAATVHRSGDAIAAIMKNGVSVLMWFYHRNECIGREAIVVFGCVPHQSDYKREATERLCEIKLNYLINFYIIENGDDNFHSIFESELIR